MANIATAVRIAVDASALNSARQTASEFTSEVSNRLPAAFTRAAGAAGAVGAALAAAYAIAQQISEQTQQQVQRGYDFTNNVDANLRPAMVFVAEQFAAMNAEAEQLDDLIALADSDWTMKFERFGNTVQEYWTSFRTGGRDAQQIVDDLIESIAASQGRTVEAVRQEMDDLNDAAQALSDSAFERQLLGFQRLSMSSREYREEQLRLLQIEHDAQVTLADSPEQAEALQRRLDRVMDAQRQMNDALNEQEAEQEAQRQRGLERELRMMEIQNMNQVEAMRARWEMERDDLERRYNENELNEEQMNRMRIELALSYREQLRSIQEQADQEALRQTERTAREMANATSSALSIVDDDLAALYDSLNSLASVLQNLGWLSGAGGIFGIGGIGNAGASRSGGIHIGSFAVTVNGGTNRTAEAARQGVTDGLNGIIKQQIVSESQYGGVLNPNSGVTQV
ncbi:coiled-coil domain-containing protein [Vibrio astriarenae]|uniref:hypothetical protein n=1 Tax=Vibrio astriarenae TaxID=1481923 RepID=UPI003736AD50